MVMKVCKGFRPGNGTMAKANPKSNLLPNKPLGYFENRVSNTLVIENIQRTHRSLIIAKNCIDLFETNLKIIIVSVYEKGNGTIKSGAL